MAVNEPSSASTPAIKDEDAQHAVASAWRPTLCQIVAAFVEGDYSLSRGVPSVAHVGASTARQIASYIADYGETLVELPEEAWTTSVSQWMGIHWDVLVDLWTAESRRSDMVLSVRVFETEDGLRIEVDSVHVP